MKTQLILLAEPILVKDGNVDKNDGWCWDKYSNTIVTPEQNFKATINDADYFCKIIAGIPELPSISYSDEAREGLEKKYGWVDDVEKLALKKLNKTTYVTYNMEIKAWIDGFKTCQSLNEKKFSEEDMRNILNRCEIWWKKEQETKSWFDLCTEIFQSLSQPKVIDVEVEMCEVGELNRDGKLFPRITNNSIKVIKVL